MKNENDSQVTTLDAGPKSGVFIPLPADQHKFLKIKAIEADTTLQSFVGQLLQEAISRGFRPSPRGRHRTA